MNGKQPALNPSAPPSPRIWLGFSGGLDSSVLLHRLRTDPQLANRPLRAIHVHHGLHPLADDWAAHCQSVCAALDIPFTLERIRIASPARNIERQARDARYAAFARHLGADDTLALAHHADDVAETLLLRLLRGAGTAALGNMAAVSRRDHYWLWRPLLDVPRAELVDYANRHALRWVEDPGNGNPDFDRNYLRHQILPSLEQRFPQARARLARSATLLREDAALLQPVVTAALAVCQNGRELALPRLLALPPALAAQVLRAWLQLAAHPSPGMDSLLEFLRQLGRHASDDATCLRGRGYRVRVWRASLYLLQGTEPGMRTAVPDMHWDGHAALVLPDGGQLMWQGQAPFPVRVGYRSGAERMRLPGRAMHHSVKKLLSTRVPPWQRAALPFVYNAEGELLAVGDVLVSAVLDDLNRRHGIQLRWLQKADTT